MTGPAAVVPTPASLLIPGPTRVFGILNVTPDSFSDGGLYTGLDAAVARGRTLVEQGAAVVDVGGESTRPGAERVSEADELARVVPVVRALVSDGIAVSVDTMRSRVAEEALAAGAVVVNDVSGGLADPGLPRLLARTDALYVVMHWRGHSDQMATRAVYDDVVAEVRAELLQRVDAVTAAGVDPARLVLDPGLGFAKDAGHNWALLDAVGAFEELGFPVLWGHSRKRFLATVADGRTDTPADRDARSVEVTGRLAQAGVWAVRTHTVAEHVAAISEAGEVWRGVRTTAGRAEAQAAAGDR